MNGVEALITDNFLRGRGRRQLSAEDIAMLEAAIERTVDLPARHTLIHRGEHVRSSTLLVDGYLCRVMSDRDERQLVAVHVPGDFVDLHAFPMKHLDHDVATLGPARVALVPHTRLETLVETRPNLARMLWFSTLLDAAMHREWIFRLGRLDAMGRVAHFFCEVAERLRMIGQDNAGRFSLPLTQVDLAAACGLTPVHVNRVLRALRERDALDFKSGEVTVRNDALLCDFAEFDPSYLYPGGPDA